MMTGHTAIRIAFLFFAFSASHAIAQPTLPDIAGSADKGIVILSWVCQYEGVKNITVMRSTDSNNINKPIGNVKKLDKGLQAFVDAHAPAGKSFYKVVVTFRSGLTWGSNRLGIYVTAVPPNGPATPLPANDSIQHFTVTEELSAKTKPVAATTAAPPKTFAKSDVPKTDKHADTAMANKPVITSINSKANVGSGDTVRDHKVLISFDPEPGAIIQPTTQGNNIPPPPKKKVTIAFDDPSGGASTFILSQYIFTDPVTGHVDMNLPTDVATHRYAVRFYDAQGHMIIEVPKIYAEKIILDKRNFQRKGIYRFVLRRDVVELESGYVTVY